MFLLPILAAAADVGETKAQAEQRAVEQHARMDSDRDGYVTYDEVRLAIAAMLIPKEKMAEFLKSAPDLPAEHGEFDKLDTNRDGRVSLAEAIAASDRDFDEMDTNHDGKVSFAERMAYQQNHLQALQTEMQKEIAALPPLPCKPGATCDHSHR